MAAFGGRESRGKTATAPLTTYRHRVHNDAVHCRLLALLFCLTAWATLAQMVPASADTTTNAAAGVSSETQAGAPRGAGDSDNRWDARYRANVSVTESLWKSSVVHADLAAARSGEMFIETYTVGRRDRPTGNRSAHLLHIPLLI
jgi:hypothetical protein